MPPAATRAPAPSAPSSLVDRVRGEQIPVNGVHLRLLEVVVDEKCNPLWRARCLQTGRLLTVALDGLVQVPVTPAPPQDSEVFGDGVAPSHAPRRRRWKLALGSLLLAGLAFAFHEELAIWVSTLWQTYQSGDLPLFPRPS